MIKTPTLTTQRLQLRPLTPADAPALFQLYSDPETMRFIPILPHTNPTQTEQYLTTRLALNNAHYWAISSQDDPQLLGFVCYLGNTHPTGMGYILHRDYWGRGFIPEACRAALDYGFNHLNLDRVELWIDEDNVPSQRVARKLGFLPRGRLLNKFAHEPASHVTLVYGMSAHEWRGISPATPAPHIFNGQPVLMVYDVQKTAVFYRDKLDFRIDFFYGDPPTHASVTRSEWSGSGLTIQLSQAPADTTLNPAAYLYLFVHGPIDTLYQQYQANGVDIVASPQDQPWGLREFTIRDPNGHQLRFGMQL